MELFYEKIRTGEIAATLRPPCSPEALVQAQHKMITLYAALPADYSEFLALHNGFQGGNDITLCYVADPDSPIENMRDKSGPMELLMLNSHYHAQGLPDAYVIVGECDLGIMVWDSEEKEYIVIDPDGFDEFEGYDGLEDLVLDMEDPEYMDDEEEEEEES